MTSPPMEWPSAETPHCDTAGSELPDDEIVQMGANHSAQPSWPRVLSRSQVRDVDRRAIENYGLPGLVLMENAGRSAVEVLCELGVHGPVVICCGKGNNGGDGLVMARHLENAGHSVRVLLTTPASDIRGDAAVELNVLRCAGTPILDATENLAESWQSELSQADWIIDALLGTGARLPIEEPFVSAINSINAAGKKVLAIDIPSGLDCDTGAGADACVRASHTVTFVARKPCFELPFVRAVTGPVHVVDIGVPRALLIELMKPDAS
jgi:NAD(P)H-hydrate epimerase